MRIAVIGAGYIGPVNTKALLECSGVEIAAIANRTVEKAKRLCTGLQLSCPVYADYRVMLEEVKPQAAVICLFNDLHKDAFLECARRGIHVLVEKPLGNTWQECREMMDAAQKTGIKASVLQTQRYGAVLQTAKDYITKNAVWLGRLLSVSDRISCHYFWEGRSPWHLDDQRSGGGILMNYGVHQLDRVLWLLGEKTKTIYRHCLREKAGIDTVSSYTLMGVTEQGTPYTVTCNGYAGPWVNEIDLMFEHGLVRCVLTDNGQTVKGVYAGIGTALEAVPLICEDGEAAHWMYVRQMTEAVRYLEGTEAAPPVSLEWAAELVKLCKGTA